MSSEAKVKTTIGEIKGDALRVALENVETDPDYPAPNSKALDCAAEICRAFDRAGRGPHSVTMDVDGGYCFHRFDPPNSKAWLVCDNDGDVYGSTGRKGSAGGYECVIEYSGNSSRDADKAVQMMLKVG